VQSLQTQADGTDGRVALVEQDRQSVAGEGKNVEVFTRNMVEEDTKLRHVDLPSQAFDTTQPVDCRVAQILKLNVTVDIRGQDGPVFIDHEGGSRKSFTP
jgi:hypothetical protein